MNVMLLFNTGSDFGRLDLNLKNNNLDSADSHLFALIEVDIPMLQEEHGIDLSKFTANFSRLRDILSGEEYADEGFSDEQKCSVALKELEHGLEGKLQSKIGTFMEKA